VSVRESLERALANPLCSAGSQNGAFARAQAQPGVGIASSTTCAMAVPRQTRRCAAPQARARAVSAWAAAASLLGALPRGRTCTGVRTLCRTRLLRLDTLASALRSRVQLQAALCQLQGAGSLCSRGDSPASTAPARQTAARPPSAAVQSKSTSEAECWSVTGAVHKGTLRTPQTGCTHRVHARWTSHVALAIGRRATDALYHAGRAPRGNCAAEGASHLRACHAVTLPLLQAALCRVSVCARVVHTGCLPRSSRAGCGRR
jgi:hypothetical protein